MKRLFLCLLFVLAFTIATGFAKPATAPSAPVGKEYIILSGGPSLLFWEKWKNPPHDKWWMNFIRAAEVRIQELEAQGVAPTQNTWLVYQPAYVARSKQEGQNLLGVIESLHTSLGVNLKYFSRSKEVLGYLNSGKPRDRIKVGGLEYFGHSNKACWMFDYSNLIDSASKVWIHEDELNQIQPGIFANDAFIKSWGCHTGESMSQKFRRFTGMRMWGATGRTQYMTHEVPTLAAPESSKWRY